MPAGKPLRRHLARVEFLACKETVDSMLAQGFSKKLIHERLTEEGRFSMAYMTLCEIVRKTRDKPAAATPSPLPAAKRQPAASQGSGSRFVSSLANKFPDPRDMDPEDAM
jgi:hypothetical protein